MAFFAAGVFKGAQHLKREAKKNRQRNAIISADGAPSAGAGSHIDSLSIEQDWWGGDGGSYRVDSELSEGGASASSPPPPRMPRNGREEESTFTLPLPSVVSSIDIDEVPPPSPTTTKRRPPKARTKSGSAPTRGSFAEAIAGNDGKNDSVSSDASSSARCIRQEAIFGGDGKMNSARAAPAGVESEPLPPCTDSRLPRRMRTAPVANSGSFAEAVATSNSSARRSGPPRLQRSHTSKRGTFLEATKADTKWEEFISKVENDHDGVESRK